MDEAEARPESAAARVAAVRGRIAAAATRAGRDPACVTLVAATKSVSPQRIRPVLEAGVTVLGENRAQELVAKAPVLADGPVLPVWHFIGRLQRNKVRSLVPWVSCWETLDRFALVPILARHAPGASVLVEVNLAGEPTKTGVAPAQAPALVEEARNAGLAVEGLMTIPPLHEDPRPWFVALRELATRLGLGELSMGMTDDFEIAVEEGATIVRVGRALFGERPAGPPALQAS